MDGDELNKLGETSFRDLADHAPVMMWITDPTGRCVYLNRPWYEFTGQTPEEAEGFGWLDATHPEDRAEATEVFVSANARREPFRLEYRLRAADGSYRWAIDAARPRFAESGEFLGYVGSVIDIEDRREAEQRLRFSEERLRLASDSADIGFWDVDVVHDILFWPPRVKRMFGIFDDAPITMQDFYDGLHPDDRERTTQAYVAACDPRQRALYDVEYRTVGKQDGRVRTVAAKGRAIFDEDGRCLRVLGAAIDITASRRTQAALRESEARYRTLFEAIDAGFCVVEVDLDAGGRIDYRVVEANPAFYAQTGFPQTIFGRWLREAAPSLEEHWYERYGQVARTGQALRFEDGSDTLGRWFDVYAFPTGEADGRRVAILFNDISNRLRAERALQDLNARLEHTVDERTGDLVAALDALRSEAAERERAEEALRQSQKLESMGQLTGGVAHDFNNLLTPIIGSLDLLERKKVGGEREQRLIAGAIQSAERAKTLVQRLLAFARRQPLQATSVDVGRLVENMADLIASTTGPQIRVAVDVPDALPMASADTNQIEMALLNLAVNARDAMPDGGTLRIAIRAETVEEGAAVELRPGDYLRLSVADTGVGMDAATLARAVEPFFSTKGVGKGTGLGLSMVHGLASQLGGALRIDSRVDIGTNVELWLPVSRAPVSRAPVDAVEAAAPGPQAAGAGVVLLVDDEELVRMTTADMLIDLGYSVVEAASAEQAMALVDGGLRPDVLVTDHLMPGVNGADLARDLRAQRPGLKALIVSGYAESDGVAPDLARLTKPFRAEELAASLAALDG